jgi:hypothetical protein
MPATLPEAIISSKLYHGSSAARPPYAHSECEPLSSGIHACACESHQSKGRPDLRPSFYGNRFLHLQRNDESAGTAARGARREDVALHTGHAATKALAPRVLSVPSIRQHPLPQTGRSRYGNSYQWLMGKCWRRDRMFHNDRGTGCAGLAMLLFEVRAKRNSPTYRYRINQLPF